MRRNVELKAVDRDPVATLAAALAAGAVDRGTLRQTDTYFHAVIGRLKLREQQPGTAELIQYDRADQPGARPSDHRIVPAFDPAPLKDALAAALGVRQVVEKERRLLLGDGDATRIHLDRVARLGAFVEIEAVVQPGERVEQAAERAARWRAHLGIADADLVPRGYADLLPTL